MPNDRVVFYRSARAFPPGESELIPLAVRRNRPDGIGPTPEHRRASLGLSTYRTLEFARRQGRLNLERIGHLLIRYAVPPDSPFSLVHAIGDDDHLTLYGPFEILVEYLDRDWVEDLSAPTLVGGLEE